MKVIPLGSCVRVSANCSRELVGMQPGDVPVTYADSTALERDYGFTPAINIRTVSGRKFQPCRVR